ncbi:MAG: hypothetical protein IJ539_03025 [Prevotella sp.]|nr:hypothetical protein [Prevotella sp.]
MKKFFYLAAAVVTLAACTSDEFVGNDPGQSAKEGKSISFNSSSFVMTRADITGVNAAELLGKNFVVEGVKVNGTTPSVVYDNYNVNWVNNSANTTLSNTHNWEYVGQDVNANSSAGAQTIKYWDYSADQYDFIAYSLGTSTGLTVSSIDASKKNGVITSGKVTDGAFTISGSADQLAKAYIADMVTAYREPIATTDFNKVVQFKFRSLSAKVRIALYETIPGYSVKDVKFYTDASTVDASGKAHLFTEGTGTDVFNKEGKYIVYYPTTGSTKTTDPDYNKAHVAFEAATSGTETSKEFGTLDLTNTGADKESFEEAGKVYLGRQSDKATFAGENSTATPNYYTLVIPNETGAQLNLKVDYTLVSLDGNAETIKVTGAQAQVPAVYGSWKPGYAYTYLFKISWDTNGYTNPGAGPAGLYPITFDAVVVDAEDGAQETITTVSTPSITTFSKGKVVTANDEYKKDANIYVVVDNGTELTVGTNANLYTVTIEAGAAQEINEGSVANAIKNGGSASPYVVTDANGKKLTVTSASGLTAFTEIPAADAPSGTALTVKGAFFKPTAAGTYAFEYNDGAKKHYKIIKVVD